MSNFVFCATDNQQRNNSFLPRITNSSIQNKLSVFRGWPNKYIGSENVWIDVKAVDADSFHWIDGSSLTGLYVSVLVVHDYRVLPR